jgi:hypothetical protein
MLTKMSSTQDRLFEIFGLEALAPPAGRAAWHAAMIARPDSRSSRPVSHETPRHSIRYNRPLLSRL